MMETKFSLILKLKKIDIFSEKTFFLMKKTCTTFPVHATATGSLFLEKEREMKREKYKLLRRKYVPSH